MPRLPRSPSLLNAADSALLVVDIQEKLISLIPEHERLVWNVRRLIDAARLFEIPIGVTEQYPQGLGPTCQPLRDILPPALAKITFSCAECGELFEGWQQAGRWKIVVAGIESHVCVQQTVLDLIAAGFDPYLVVDAMGARFSVDHDTAIRRMENAGAVITTTESIMFEWCDQAGHDRFREISRLVREAPPVLE